MVKSNHIGAGAGKIGVKSSLVRFTIACLVAVYHFFFCPVREANVNIIEVLPPCRPLNITAAEEGIVCIPKCKPHCNHTIEGLGLDANEKVNITIRQSKNYYTHEYGKYRTHFPEENIYLNHSSQSVSIHEAMQPRAVTERLFRRIIAKLFRAGVLDPSKNIINTGSWIGDNAVSWALMLEQLTENPGKVIAVDPSEKYLQYMTNIANENSIGNICTHLTVYSSEERTIFASTTEHMGVDVRNKKGTAIKAIPIDSENIENLALLHIDVEGHESELLAGALGLIHSSRPVVSTECCCSGSRICMEQNETYLSFDK
jgi:FkbM family methyltransferase